MKRYKKVVVDAKRVVRSQEKANRARALAASKRVRTVVTYVSGGSSSGGSSSGGSASGGGSTPAAAPAAPTSGTS